MEVVFVTKNPNLVAKYSPNGADERAIPDVNDPAMSEAERAVAKNVLKAVSEYQGCDIMFLWADFYKATNITWINKNEIGTFPSVQITANYPDGRNKYIRIEGRSSDYIKNVFDLLCRDVEQGESSILCRLFPPLCALSAWAWLAVTLYAAYEATQTKGPARAAWIGGAVLAGNEFLQRGGLKTISLDKAPALTAQQPNSLTAR